VPPGAPANHEQPLAPSMMTKLRGLRRSRKCVQRHGWHAQLSRFDALQKKNTTGCRHGMPDRYNQAEPLSGEDRIAARFEPRREQTECTVVLPEHEDRGRRHVGHGAVMMARAIVKVGRARIGATIATQCPQDRPLPAEALLTSDPLVTSLPPRCWVRPSRTHHRVSPPSRKRRLRGVGQPEPARPAAARPPIWRC